MALRALKGRTSSPVLDDLVVPLFADALLGVLAPLYAARDVVIDDEPAIVAGDLDVGGKDLHIVAALRAFLDG